MQEAREAVAFQCRHRYTHGERAGKWSPWLTFDTPDARFRAANGHVTLETRDLYDISPAAVRRDTLNEPRAMQPASSPQHPMRARWKAEGYAQGRRATLAEVSKMVEGTLHTQGGESFNCGCGACARSRTILSKLTTMEDQ